MSEFTISVKGVIKPKYYINSDQFCGILKTSYKLKDTRIRLSAEDGKMIYEVIVINTFTKALYKFPNNTYTIKTHIAGVQITDSSGNEYKFKREGSHFELYRNNVFNLATIELCQHDDYKYFVTCNLGMFEDVLECIIIFLTHNVTDDRAVVFNPQGV